MQDNSATVAEPTSLPHPILHTIPQSTSVSSRSLNIDPTSVRYHVVSNPHESDCESGIVHSSLQLNASRSGAGPRTASDGTTGLGTVNHRSQDRRRRSRYRNRRNRIGLLLVFAMLLLFAGLVICANTKEYVAGATISVIGVLLGSSSMVLCLLTTDSCERVHGFRERVSSFSQRRRSASGNTLAADTQRTQPRHGGDAASASISIANSTVHGSMVLQTLPPTAVCNISGDFLDHLPPPTYETAEILRREDMVGETSHGGGVLGAAGGPIDYQYYKVSQTEDNTDALVSSSTNLAAISGATSATSHMCDECVQRQQQNLDAGVAAVSSTSHIHEEQLLLAPAIVVELPTYDEAIAEDM